MLVALFAIVATTAKADEGMWLLPFMKQLNYKQMKKQGLKLKAEDIYSIDKSSLKDAIVIFGRGCTGEVISDKSLILTNHHCGFDAIQQHSSVEHDYLKDGFWAMSMEEEIYTPDLEVTYIREIEDVTEQVLSKIGSNLTEEQRESAVAAAIAEISANAKKRADVYPGSQVSIVPMLGGNQFVLFIKQIYTDVRMVGAPPSSIGKFGGDTDNWMWPRHTGDFALFRVYSDIHGNPAKYSANNIPLPARESLTISLKGVEENDFAMIMGFPGRTQRYMTTWEMDEATNITNLNRIYVRGIRQDILLEDMKNDPKVKIQYASKYAQSSNYWKNSIGQNRGLEKLKVRDSKAKIESDFNSWVAASPERQAKYGKALKNIEEAVTERRDYVEASQYLVECLLQSTEILSFANYASSLQKLLASGDPRVQSAVDGLKNAAESIYKDYNMPTDRKVAKAMFAILADRVDPEYRPASFDKLITQYGGIDSFVDYLYNNSIFATKESFTKFLENPTVEALVSDPAVILNIETRMMYMSLQNKMPKRKFNEGHRLFIAGLTEMNPEKSYYPDANFTLRMTYGNVLPYNPKDGVTYNYTTSLAGVIEKYDPNNLYEFDVPAKLKELYEKKDYGRYAAEGEELTVAFLSNNDITGGNSGSPVLNGKGQLIGTAFDGNWEAMSGDIAFEPALQRTINVDIRYTLFIIEKFAGCTRLIDEMNFAE